MRTESARSYSLHEAGYSTLYAFIRAVQRTCIAACCDPRLYTKGDRWGVLAPLSREFVDAICKKGFDALLVRLEFVEICTYRWPILGALTVEG